jgi:hypothetical protein
VKTIRDVDEPAKSPPGVGGNDLERWHRPSVACTSAAQ